LVCNRNYPYLSICSVHRKNRHTHGQPTPFALSFLKCPNFYLALLRGYSSYNGRIRKKKNKKQTTTKTDSSKVGQIARRCNHRFHLLLYSDSKEFAKLLRGRRTFFAGRLREAKHYLYWGSKLGLPQPEDNHRGRTYHGWVLWSTSR